MTQPAADPVAPAHPRPELIRIYLNDHLAAATGAVALAGRLLGAHRGTPAELELIELARDIRSDREALLDIMRQLDICRVFYKERLAVAAERVGRLKLNGSLVRRSPLSSVVELEGLALAVTGKAAAWRTLRALSSSLPGIDEDRLTELLGRSDRQLAVLERLRVQAVAESLRPA